MRLKDIDDREVEVDICFQWEDSYLSKGVYVDNGAECPEPVLEYLQDRYADLIDQEVYENASCRAYDMAKDRYKYGTN